MLQLKQKKLDQADPVIIIRGMPKHPKDGFLVCEKSMLPKIYLADLPTALFTAYYVFKIQYCAECTNFLLSLK